MAMPNGKRGPTNFEVHAEQPERAIRFYRDVLGWEFTKWAGPQEYWLIKTGPDGQPGINGGMIPRKGAVDGQAVIAYVCTVDTPSVDEYLKKAQASGGTVAVPKMPIPGVGWLAYCKDTEGNIFGLMQADPKAG
jgi:predicted enzyme related to lactoylglutathione lyase